MIRFFDVFLSGIALIVLSPMLIPVMLFLKFSGEREVFFLQERIGKNKKIFRLFKFATMIKNSSSIGTGTVTVKDDPRILPLGKFLRKTKINELPQLLNVFLGDMSIIGPRPQTSRCFEVFPINVQEAITQIKPGLSGVGPIVFRDEEEILEGHSGSLDFYDNIIAPYKGNVEAWYVGKESLFFYFSLIFLTIWIVIFPKSDLIWRIFKDLPVPPDDLKTELKYRP